MRSFASVTKVRAPIDVVWGIMTDHGRYAEWSSARSVSIERPGSPDPNGLGAVRVFHTGLVRVREEVVEWQPPLLMVYRLDSGLPVRDYRSEMRLAADGAATVLDWSSTFTPRVPLTGRLFTSLMAHAVDRFAAGIKAAAERAYAEADR